MTLECSRIRPRPRIRPGGESYAGGSSSHCWPLPMENIPLPSRQLPTGAIVSYSSSPQCQLEDVEGTELRPQHCVVRARHKARRGCVPPSRVAQKEGDLPDRAGHVDRQLPGRQTCVWPHGCAKVGGTRPARSLQCMQVVDADSISRTCDGMGPSCSPAQCKKPDAQGCSGTAPGIAGCAVHCTDPNFACGTFNWCPADQTAAEYVRRPYRAASCCASRSFFFGAVVSKQSRPMSEYDMYNFLAEGSAFGSPNGLPWVTLARRSYRHENPRYHHTEWPGPVPSAWHGTIFDPPSNPTSAASLSQTCAGDLIRSNVCRVNTSCQLGILSAIWPQLVQRSSDTRDDVDFRQGRTLHKQCVDRQIQSYFGPRGAVGTA